MTVHRSLTCPENPWRKVGNFHFQCIFRFQHLRKIKKQIINSTIYILFTIRCLQIFWNVFNYFLVEDTSYGYIKTWKIQIMEVWSDHCVFVLAPIEGMKKNVVCQQRTSHHSGVKYDGTFLLFTWVCHQCCCR